MLRWMSGNISKDQRKNEKYGVIQRQTKDKMRETRWRWFGSVQRRDTDASVRKVYYLELTCISRGGEDLRKLEYEPLKMTLRRLI